MGIKDFGEWKHYAFGRFKCILDLVVKNAANRNRVEHSDLMFRLLRSNARIPPASNSCMSLFPVNAMLSSGRFPGEEHFHVRV